MSRRVRSVVPAAWISNVPRSMAPALTSTSGGWITGPTLVSATSTASTHGRVAGYSSRTRASASLDRDAGKTPTGRLPARTGAATAAGPVLRARYGSVPVSASASGSARPARAISRAIAHEPRVAAPSRELWVAVG